MPYPNGAFAAAPCARWNGMGPCPATREAGGSERADREQRKSPGANTREPEAPYRSPQKPQPKEQRRQQRSTQRHAGSGETPATSKKKSPQTSLNRVPSQERVEWLVACAHERGRRHTSLPTAATYSGCPSESLFSFIQREDSEDLRPPLTPSPSGCELCASCVEQHLNVCFNAPGVL
jgi:hypothetical protein